jgi:hypothetical protein
MWEVVVSSREGDTHRIGKANQQLMCRRKKMRKLTVLAMMAAVLMAGSAFAVSRNLAKQPDASFQFGVGGAAFGPSTTNNNDTCDIGVAPAATLLVPYFEVDFSSASATRNTLFTIVNTSRQPQIAHIVLWTDWSFAALDFNIFLTGYDVQSISMRDIFGTGVIAPSGASSGTSISGSVNGPGTATTPTLATERTNNINNGAPGAAMLNNVPAPGDATGGNPNFLALAATNCVGLPGAIPSALLADLRQVFTTGVAGSVIGAGCTVRLGGTHTNAIGYITIDVASNCSTNLPGPAYFTTDVLFDNVLIGDYEDLFGAGASNGSGGAPMVHIRAIPEGGPSGSNPIAAGGTAPTNLPFTFYDRYTGSGTQVGRAIDRRQPLPSTFAARWIQGGTGALNTNFRIWREGIGSLTGSSTTCTATAPSIPPSNSALAITDEVRFDEHENAVGVTIPAPISPSVPGAPVLPEASNTATSTSLPFPPAVPGSADVGGWMYLNLSNGGTGAVDFRLTAQRAGFGPALGNRTTTQNWVVVNMQALPTLSATFDAAWLGNGCTPAPGAGAQIAPATQRPAGTLVCPPPLAPAAGCPAQTQPSNPTP